MNIYDLRFTIYDQAGSTWLLLRPVALATRHSSLVTRMTAPNHYWRQFKDILMQVITFACAILVVTPLILIFYHIVKEGFSSINLAFFTQLPKPLGEKGGGMANAIVGTFVLLAEAAVVGVPIGVLGGVFLSEYGGTRLNWGIRFGADILNGVPSITWGVVVYALMVVPMHGASALAGGVVLGLMMIPLVMRTTEEVLQLVPGGYREAALALGIAKWRTIVQIVIRTALKGIVTGVLLALARVAGETAPLLFTTGNLGWAHKLTEPIAAIPLQIYVYAISPYDDWHRQAWAGAFVLLLLVLAINVGVRFFTRDRFQRKA
ncbi:MAG TPA: phosphate ABC transporter permease PstA [Candidatus Limnocylindrales bacterium]|nr:phosphate ABC transporter permease PstA [Candidatus Limnocylindrales bacterium]